MLSPFTNPTTSVLQIHTSVLDSLYSSLYAHILIHQVQNYKLLSFSLQNQCLLLTTCFISMYKNMYKPKSKISLLLSFIATMLVEIQGEKMRKQKDKRSEDMKMVKPHFFLILPFFGHILKKSTHSLFGAWFTLGLHLVRAQGPNGLLLVLC